MNAMLKSACLKYALTYAFALVGALASAARPTERAGQLAPVATAVSPDGRNEIRLYAGPLRYEVRRDRTVLVVPTPVNLRVGGRDLAALDARPLSVVARPSSGTLATPVYKKAAVDLAANGCLADFGDWGLALVARDDGVAYRFELKFAGTVRVDGETAGVTVPSGDAPCIAYYELSGRSGCEEAVSQGLAAKDVACRRLYLPFVYTAGGKTVAVTEADVYDYPIWDLQRVSTDSLAFAGQFAPWPTAFANDSGEDRAKGARRKVHWRVTAQADYLVETEGTRTLPWRVFALADAPSALMESDIVRALARPAAADADFSWVKPGKVAWEWWNDWDNQGKAKGCNTQTYERFIDFAASNGIEYVILDDGWSLGHDITRFSPAVDVPHLIAYGAARNVGIVLWMGWAQAEGDEERVAARFAKLGVKGFKVDFIDRGDAASERFLWKFAAACARNRMVVDYHGVHRPTGMSRAYPNVLNYEGVHGLEMMKVFSGQADILGHDVRLCYSRLVAGPMDYTPGAMDNYPFAEHPRFDPKTVDRSDPATFRENRPCWRNPGSVGTRARQMAMLAIYEAPLQMLCDAPTKYARERECLSFMSAIPTVWDDVKALGGTPETYAALARRKGDVWYAAAIGNAAAQFVRVETAFLGEGDWCVEIFRDADDSDKSPAHYVHETATVRSGEPLTFRLAPGGGFVARFTRSAEAGPLASVTRPLNDGWTADGVPVTLPHCWNVEDGTDGPTDPKSDNHDSVAGTDYGRQKVVYRRDLPPPTPGMNRYLRVHAASIHAVVKVDGREIGRHAGAFTAFTFALPADARNLEIVVDNFFDPDVPPIGGDFTMYGGLYRGVDLIEAPPERVFVAADGLFADELVPPKDLPRYEFREDGFYIDGHKTFLKGVCYHQDREGKGWAISPEDEEEDIKLIQAMGANAIRTSHYPRSERFYDLCDKYGLFVWTEVPLVDATTDSAAFRSNALQVAREMVLQHRRHKCIAMWGLFNELYHKEMRDGSAEPLVREVKALIRSLDPRPTVAANFRKRRPELNAIPDGIGFNLYPGWYNGESAELAERIEACRAANGRSCVAVSEYGAGGSLGQAMPSPGFRPDPGGKLHPVDYQLQHHVASWAAIRSNPRIWGAFVWQMFDNGSDNRREGARAGINDKGLVAFDHKTLKPAYEFYRREWTRPAEATRPARPTVVATNDFQAVIDAVAAAGGGTVRVPAGEWTTGGVRLWSHVTLELAEGARLVSNGDLSTYAHPCALVFAEDAVDVALVGAGEVCGAGEKFPARDNAPNRPYNVCFRRCRDFRIEGVRLTDAAAWTCSLNACSRGVVRGVKVFSHANLNNDGLDVEAQELLIEDCDIDADDDALCFKSNSPNYVGRDVRVRNVRLASNCNALKFGTASYGTWRNVTVENCAIRPSAVSRWRKWHEKGLPGGVPDAPQGLAGLAFEVVDGGVLENVTVRGVTMEGVQTPILVRLASRHEPPTGRATRLENVLVEDVTGTCLSRMASSVTGVPGKRPRGITLRNVDLTMPGGATEAMGFRRRVPEAARSYPENRMFGHVLPAWGLYLRHADDVRLENVQLRLAAADARPDAVVAEDVTGLVATDCSFTPKPPISGGL